MIKKRGRRENMFKILIIRHGDPDYENDCLTEVGKRDVSLLSEKLAKRNIDMIFSSPYGRAKQTADAIAKTTGKAVEELDFLEEFDKKILDGENEFYPWKVPGNFLSFNSEIFNIAEFSDFKKYGEFFEEGFVDKLLETSSGLCAFLKEYGFIKVSGGYKRAAGNEENETKTLAFVCHNGKGVLLLSMLCELPPLQVWRRFFLPTSSVTEIVFSQCEDVFLPTCVLLGDVSHLSSEKEENFISEV